MYRTKIFPLKMVVPSRHQILLLLILIGAIVLRVVLAASHWPLLNSDEGTIGIMAMHIQHGAHPIFYYGQHYMGALEAYIGALLFMIAGPSLFTLRLGLILLFVGFLISMYFFTRMLYNRKLALFTVLLFSLGTNAVLSRQLSAIGGYTETIFCSALAFLLVSWLAYSVAENPQRWGRRLWGYGAWGLVIGIGLWSDLLILPVAFCTAMLLLLLCWRDLLKGALVILVVGLALGALPLIVYNLGAPANQNSWAVLMSQQGHIRWSFGVLVQQLAGTFHVSIPTITGSPFCRFSEFPYLHLLGFEPSQAPTWACNRVGDAWSFSYLLLLLASCGLSFVALLPIIRRMFRGVGTLKDKQELVVHTIRIFLILSAVGTIIIYVRSTAPIRGPGVYSRYLICLWLTLPAVLWPLWKGLQMKRLNGSLPLPLPSNRRVFLCRGILLLTLVLALSGMIRTIGEIPTALAYHQQEDQLIHELATRDITHISTDYWSCNRIAFQSQERVICKVIYLDKNCSLDAGKNRYMPYAVAVSHDTLTSYVIPEMYSQCGKIVEQYLKQKSIHYQEFSAEGYTIYQPLDV